MFTNYIKRKIIHNYNVSSFQDLRGFEQVVVENLATYYVLDKEASVVITFDQNWIYHQTYSLPNNQCNCLKYGSGYFYISCRNHIYKVNSTFNIISSYKAGPKEDKYYYGCYYDNRTSLLYVVSYFMNLIDVFDTGLNFQFSISVDGFSQPQSINRFNESFFVGTDRSTFLVLKKNLDSGNFRVSSMILNQFIF